MTQGNVGSLLVFDPAKAANRAGGAGAAPGDAVVGIITERGKARGGVHCRVAVGGAPRAARAGGAADGDAGPGCRIPASPAALPPRPRSNPFPQTI